jgi:hypothetical protein
MASPWSIGTAVTGGSSSWDRFPIDEKANPEMPQMRPEKKRITHSSTKSANVKLGAATLVSSTKNRTTPTADERYGDGQALRGVPGRHGWCLCCRCHTRATV